MPTILKQCTASILDSVCPSVSANCRWLCAGGKHTATCDCVTYSFFRPTTRPKLGKFTTYQSFKELPNCQDCQDSSWVKIRLHNKNQVPWMPVTPKVHLVPQKHIWYILGHCGSKSFYYNFYIKRIIFFFFFSSFFFLFFCPLNSIYFKSVLRTSVHQYNLLLHFWFVCR
jgi:hypothetical protein